MIDEGDSFLSDITDVVALSNEVDVGKKKNVPKIPAGHKVPTQTIIF